MKVFYPGSKRYETKHKFLQYFKNTFFRTLMHISSTKKDSIATTRDSFKDFILA